MSWRITGPSPEERSSDTPIPRLGGEFCSYTSSSDRHHWRKLSSNSLDVYIGYLRRKTEADGEPRLIQTVRGVGYVARATDACREASVEGDRVVARW